MYSVFRYYSKPKDEVLSKLGKMLKCEGDILLAIVFGSFVELNEYRDVDLAVYTTRKDLGYLAKLSAKLELELGVPVDVVPIDEVPAELRHKILTRGIIVLERVGGIYEALLSQTLDEIYVLEHA